MCVCVCVCGCVCVCVCVGVGVGVCVCVCDHIKSATTQQHVPADEVLVDPHMVCVCLGHQNQYPGCLLYL